MTAVCGKLCNAGEASGASSLVPRLSSSVGSARL